MTTRSAVIDAEPRLGGHLVGDVPLTDSPIEEPGAASISSIVWRTPIEPRSVAEDLLGLFPVTRWPVVDPAYESGLRAELTRVLGAVDEPAPRTAALVSLLAAVDAAAKVVPSADRRAVKRRAKELARGEWAGAALRQAVDAVNGAVAASIVAVTVAPGSDS